MITELMPETIRRPVLVGRVGPRKEGTGEESDEQANATLGRNTVRILGAGPKEAAWKLRAEHASQDDTMECTATSKSELICLQASLYSKPVCAGVI